MKLKYLAILIVIMLLLLAVGCAKKEAPAPAPAPAPEPTPAPVEEAPVEEPAEEVVDELEDVVLEEGGDVTAEAEQEKEATGLAADLTTESDAFPQTGCELKEVDGKEVREIIVKIKNIEADEWVIYGKINPKGNVRIGNRGVIDIEPGCEKTILQPGESTLCSDVNVGAAMEGENRVTVNTPGQQYARVVVCP